MIHLIEKLQDELPPGSSRPVLAVDEHGNKWVFKWLGNPHGAKGLFNEFVSGRLAAQLELPWPETRVASLSESALDQMRLEKYPITSSIGVASKYLPGLLSVCETSVHEADLGLSTEEANRSNLLQLFCEEDLDCFWGKAVFDSWVFMQDNKYDTLKQKQDGKPVFLDGSHALGGEDWTPRQLVWPGYWELDSPYLEGIVNSVGPFEPWLERVRTFTREDIRMILSMVPVEWGVEKDDANRFEYLFALSGVDFVNHFRSGYDYFLQYLE